MRRDDESDEGASEPKDEGELTSQYEGSHSPFGFVWQIASATGWPVRYILDGVNYQTLIMMTSDTPHYVRKKSGRAEGKSVPDGTAGNDRNDIAGFFQSMLK